VSADTPTGPRVVAIGGGHGLAATLAAAATYSTKVTGIVSVADDGGSSGRLRDTSGLPALGDLRRALLALADPGAPLARAMAHRFDSGDLRGHSMGNLLIAAMVDAEGGLVEALDQIGSLVGSRGRVLPNVVDPVVLCASTMSGERVEGQVAVMGTPGVDRVWLEPDVTSPAQVVGAIGAAEQIIIGPGSLFTSVLAALVAPAVRDAVISSGARCIYVSNLRPQVPETLGLDAEGHLAALIRHGIRPDIVLCDTSAFGGVAPSGNTVLADLCGHSGAVHDPVRLAAALKRLC